MSTPDTRIMSPRQWWLRAGWFTVMMLLAVSLSMTGCGVSGSDADTGGDSTLTIALTDAPGDFLNYEVDVLSLTLTRENGDVINVLPVSTRVDFAQYTEMTEFLTGATVPAGRYVQATMTLDYSSAGIWVEDEDGNPAQATAVLDEAGNPLSTLEVQVSLEGRSSLLILPGIPSHLSLDFNLEQTNTVVFADPDINVTVSPRMVAEVNLDTHKLHRLRGLLKEVDADLRGFTVYVRPFRTAIDDGENRYGVVPVQTFDETRFKVDGVDYTGDEGLSALQVSGAGTRLMVLGDVRFNPRRFVARAVFAGTSLPGGDLDMVTGSVLSREGNIITVHGAMFVNESRSVLRRKQVQVQLAETTQVSRQLSNSEYSHNDISVGQRITVLGIVDGASIEALSMDASEGFARMWLSNLTGTVISAPAAVGTEEPLVLNLAGINFRPVGAYNFLGTGTDMANDADPMNYEIDEGQLDLTSLTPDTVVRVRGFVRPFGQAPADFSGVTVVEPAE